MTVRPPRPDEMAAVAARYGLGLSDRRHRGVRAVRHGPARLVGQGRAAVRQDGARRRPSGPGSGPSDAENPLGAWYVRTEITEADGGPLAGRTVAIKDNTMVAGVPMMNGSRTVEGFVPTRDATVVTRLLAAGATITGKAVCEDLCFSGGSHTSAPGRCATRGTRRAARAGRPAAARRWSRPARSTWRRAVTRAARCASRAPTAGPSGTSRPTAWCPTPGRSRSSRPSTTSGRSPARSPTRR